MNDATLSSQTANSSEPSTSQNKLGTGHKHAYSNRSHVVERMLSRAAASGHRYEVLVEDSRADLTPAQMVEGKLIRMLRGNPLPVRYMLNKARR